MNRFYAMEVFRAVAQDSSFAAAARALNTSPPTISRVVGELEDDLGVRLFNRSTRQVSLTEEGEDLLRRGMALIDEFNAITEEIRERREVPRGHLRISSVVSFGQEHVAPSIPAFMDKHPGVTVELDISNRRVDLIQEHFDLAIRVGGADGLAASNLKARKIATQKLIFVATPDYVTKHGAPRVLADLARHKVVKHISGNWGRENTFQQNGNKVHYALPETFIVNSPTAGRNVVMTGRALGLIADYLVAPQIADGRLVRLLADYETVEQPIYAVFVHKHFMPAKVRAFLDHLIQIG